MLRNRILISLTLVVVLALGLGLVGCGKSGVSGPIIGSWSPKSQPSTVWQFDSNGTFTQKNTGGGKLPGATGTFTISGQNLTMVLGGSGQPVTTTATVQFPSNNEMDVTVTGMGALQFTRVK
jgi:uncharacterized protein (TIGR03066 family)